MDIGAIFIMLAMTILVIAFIARPLVSRRGSLVSEAEHRLSALQAERDKVLALIQEMELDHAAGKIPDGDYLPQRAALVQNAAEILRAIDGLQAAVPETGASPGQDLEARIEAAVAKLRQTPSSEVVERHCTHCGVLLVEGDRFCSRCGTPVALEEPAR